VKTEPSPSPAAYAGKCLLVTGAGGFIGAALTSALAAGSPRFLVLLDHSEQNLHEIELAMREAGNIACAAILGDVGDENLLAEILDRYRPEIIFHAAACKHVPLMEKNPFAALRTNAIGTWRLVSAAARSGVAQLLLISTDKAVKPASVMGATKRVAELALERFSGQRIILQTVRLGNVLGSHGSVGPLFARQIAEGGPVTVTHPDMERYFFTREEATRIILRVAGMRPGIFVPQLPPPMKITALAERMIGEAQNAGAGEIALEFTGTRPGDKLREEFVNEGERAESSEEEGLLRVTGRKFPEQRFDAAMRQLEEFVEQRHLGKALEILRELVPAYTPSNAVLELVNDASVAKA
jgi:FlaA1/EpsC-like NDP-sugar epimerase